jgi:hypothetical protein
MCLARKQIKVVSIVFGRKNYPIRQLTKTSAQQFTAHPEEKTPPPIKFDVESAPKFPSNNHGILPIR